MDDDGHTLVVPSEWRPKTVTWQRDTSRKFYQLWPQLDRPPTTTHQ